MFKPCPTCGFLVALIAGREASQRCPRCGSALLADGESPPAEEPGVLGQRGAAAARSPLEGEAIGGRSRTDAAAAPGTQAAAGVVAQASDRTPPPATGGGPPIDPVRAPEPIAPHGHETPDAALAPPRDPQADAAAQASAVPASEERHAPSFAARRPRAPRPADRRWPWMVALPLLALLLALQLLLSQRAELARDARWRPAVAATCRVLGCDLPPWREPQAFAMLARSVGPHATRAGVLHVATSLRNDARWPQPLPTVVLSLSDVDGKVLAARAVAPGEYGRRGDALVQPGDSVDIAFDVREPSPRVVSFDFQLR